MPFAMDTTFPSNTSTLVVDTGHDLDRPFKGTDRARAYLGFNIVEEDPNIAMGSMVVVGI